MQDQFDLPEFPWSPRMGSDISSMINKAYALPQMELQG